MTPKKFAGSLILGAVIICLLASPFDASPQRAKPKEKPNQAEEKIYIPKEIKAVLEDGLPTRQGRQDIAVSVFHSLFLPARENLHAVFFLKIKNSDLDFAPIGAASAAQPGLSPVSGPSLQEAAAEQPSHLQASFNVFMQFNRLEETALKPLREVYVPASIQVESEGFDPEKEETCTVGYPLPPGRYVLAMALTSLDLQKIGTAYYEFTLPDPAAFTKELGTTPVFFIKEFNQMEAPETTTRLHRRSFTYSVLNIVPNLENVFTAGENLDVFFFIFGAQASDQQKFDIEVNYEVMKGEEFAIRWTPQKYESPLVSQPLPLKQTVMIKSGEEQRTEQRDLEPGAYTLVIEIQDKISGRSVTQKVDFEMK